MTDVLSFGAGMIVGGIIASILWVVVVYELEQRKQKEISAIIHNATIQALNEFANESESECPPLPQEDKK